MSVFLQNSFVFFFSHPEWFSVILMECLWRSLSRYHLNAEISNSFFLNVFIYYFWLCWVFVSVRGLSPVAESGGHSSSRCAGLSLSQPLLLQSTSSRRAGSVVVTHGPSCSAAWGIFPDQGPNPCPLHWQADSQPLHHQGSPSNYLLSTESNGCIILGNLHSN